MSTVFESDQFSWLCINENNIQWEENAPGFYVRKVFVSLAFDTSVDTNNHAKENLLQCSLCKKFNKEKSDRFLTISVPDQLGLVGFIYCSSCIRHLNFNYELTTIRLLNIAEEK